MEAINRFEYLKCLASNHHINLGDRVCRGIAVPPLLGSQCYTVYHGKLDDKTTVAIKISHFPLPEHKTDLDEMVHQITRWTGLRHRNVIQVFGVQFDGAVSIVTEWVPQTSACDYVRNTANDPRPLLVGIANGLNYLHTHDIVHGDLRGHNILVSDNGHPVVVDYGLWMHFYTPDLTMIEQQWEKFLEGPRWCSPEVETCGEFTIKGDIWSFGMTALELFTRERPFNDVQSVWSLPKRISEGPPHRPSDEATCCRMTDLWWEICTSCWSSEPSLRPSMCDILGKITEPESTRSAPSPHGWMSFTHRSVLLLLSFFLVLCLIYCQKF